MILRVRGAGLTPVLLVGLATLFAQEPVTNARPEEFRYERPITTGGIGPNRLAVDVPLLAGGIPFQVQRRTEAGGDAWFVAHDGLDDLRLYDSSDHEVPYLLVPPPDREPAWTEGSVLPVAATKRTSGFEVDLQQPQAVDRMKVSGLPAPLLKRVQVEGSGDRSRWTILVAEGTLFDLPDEGLQQLQLQFEPGVFRYLRLTWDDRVSARVSLPSSVSARLVSSARGPSSQRASVTFARRSSEPGRSRYRLRLPAARLPITAIELSSGGGNVSRQARITESRLSGDQMVPTLLGSTTIRRAVRGALAAAALRIPISAPTEAQLDLVIDDGDNPPLELTGISATFAELPWIYFESDKGEPLVARFGHPRLGAPRYDLEATMDAIPKLSPVAATWGERREKEPAGRILTSGALPAEGARLDIEGFRFSRTVSSGPAGLATLELDAAALAHSRFVDLRLASSDGRQVPYLLERLDEPLSITLAPLEKTVPSRIEEAAAGSAEGARTFYRLHFPYDSLPAASVVLTTPARVFRRRVRFVVEFPMSNERQEARTRAVADVTWQHADPETDALALTVRLGSIQMTNALVAVDEGDNSPLPLAVPRLLLPGHRLRFFRDTTSELTLFYGRGDLPAPRYDLALLAPRLVGASAEETTLGPERPLSLPPPSKLQARIFWGVLIAAVAILLALIVRLVRHGGAGEVKADR